VTLIAPAAGDLGERPAAAMTETGISPVPGQNPSRIAEKRTPVFDSKSCDIKGN